jgi:hypothetical protein
MDAYQTWRLDAVHTESMGRNRAVFRDEGEEEILRMKPQKAMVVAVEACYKGDTWPWRADSAVAWGKFDGKADG